MNQQLNEVLENLNDTVAKIVSSNQTRDCSSLVNKINHLTSEFEDLAARVNQSDEGRVKVHFKSEELNLYPNCLPLFENTKFLSISCNSH